MLILKYYIPGLTPPKQLREGDADRDHKRLINMFLYFACFVIPMRTLHEKVVVTQPFEWFHPSLALVRLATGINCIIQS